MQLMLLWHVYYVVKFGLTGQLERILDNIIIY